MIKFRFSLALLFAFATSIISFAHDFEVNRIYYNKNSDGTSVSVTYRGSYSNSFNGEYSGKVVIPSKVTYNGKTYSVTDIGFAAFSDCSGLTSVTIPNSVTSIGGSAFSRCDGLTSVTIPNSVTSIGGYAFEDCSGLTSITIPNSVTYIGNYAFEGTPFYNNMPNGVIYLCYVLYKYKGTMPDNSKIDINDGTISISPNAFSGCKGLTSVTIPNSVTSIGDDAFSFCSGLTSVTIPNSVTSIGDDAFRGCSRLTSVTIGNSVTSIGSYAFRDCSRLTSVTIGNSVTSIGYYAFMSCSGLTSVTIPNSVTSIVDCAFWDCSGLTSVTIGNSVTTIGNSAFMYCSGLTSVTIPNSVTTIGNEAFEFCSGLTSVTIGNSVTSIGDSAFEGTPFYNNMPNGVIYLGSVLYKYKGTMPNNSKIDINDGTISISPSAFSDCTGLTSVTIPNSVTSIGDSAFYRCYGLTSIQCDAVTPPSLGSSVFYTVDKSVCTLIVPDGSLKAYKAADQWKDFLNLSGIEEIAIEESNISIENGKIINSNNENIDVYNLSGVKVYSGNKAEVELNSGVYIVVIGNKAVKIAL